MDRQELAKRWISSAVGIVLGRFRPGVSGALGRGRFADEIAERLRALSVPHGIAALDEGHPYDLAARVFEALNITYGEEQAAEIVREASASRETLPSLKAKN